jgi:hypothetical protein
MRNRILFAITMLLLCSCQAQAICSNEDSAVSRYLTAEELASQPPPAPLAAPVQMKINGQEILVDRVVEGPLCNDAWQGTVYVSCDVRVRAWKETPLFLQGCNLSIAPGTTVYVADHNNAAYFNGCSCHTGQ